MSGFPNYPQINELRDCLTSISKANNRIDAATNNIREQQQILKEANEHRTASITQAHKLLEYMDCAHSVNYGWENRVIVLLTALIEDLPQRGGINKTQ